MRKECETRALLELDADAWDAPQLFRRRFLVTAVRVGAILRSGSVPVSSATMHFQSPGSRMVHSLQ